MKTAPFYGLLCLENGVRAGITSTIHPELHLNLWEHGDNVSLDIGLMLDINHSSNSISLYFPWAKKDNNFDDLQKLICSPAAMPAIFNENWSITTNSEQSGAVVSDSTATNKVLFVIVPTTSTPTTNNALISNSHDELSHSLTLDISKLAIKARTLSTIAEKMYVRFRVNHVPKHFYAVGIDPSDKSLISSWQSTEIIDFRLNVRRGVPSNFVPNLGTFLNFSKVHLFLMRSREHDLVFEDNLFKACRSLEDEDFWAEYSLNTTSDKGRKLPLAKKRIKDSLGYQWTKKSKIIINGPIEHVTEFSILARFKRIKFNIVVFILVAILIGALGNAFWDLLKVVYEIVCNCPKDKI